VKSCGQSTSFSFFLSSASFLYAAVVFFSDDPFLRWPRWRVLSPRPLRMKPTLRERSLPTLYRRMVIFFCRFRLCMLVLQLLLLLRRFYRPPPDLTLLLSSITSGGYLGSSLPALCLFSASGIAFLVGQISQSRHFVILCRPLPVGRLNYFKYS